MAQTTNSTRFYQAAQAADRQGDQVRARQLLREAVEAGEDAARLPLAGTLIDGRGGAVEAEKAVIALTPLETQNPAARRMLAIALALGPGGWAVALERRAGHALSGDREAMVEVGLLLADAGHEAGPVWLVRAADQGSGDALVALVRIAAGSGALWPGLRARLDDLGRAGHPLAGPLKALVKDLPETAAPPAGNMDDAAVETFAADPSALTLRRLSESPAIAIAPALLSPVLCDYLLGFSWPMLQRARVFDSAMGQTREDPHRRAHAAAIPQSLMDLPVLSIQARMARAAGVTVDRAEALAVLVYQPGDEYRAHFDSFSADNGWASAELAARGQRAATALAALNVQYEGGETSFPRAYIRWRGGLGDVLTFQNLKADGDPDPATLHSGEPVRSGWKALASLWLRERPVGPEGVAVRGAP